MFSSESGVDVWKPSKSYSKDRHADGKSGSDTDITRACTLRINCPSSILHKLWFDNHHLRNSWDTRTCLDVEKKFSFEAGSINVYWLLSQPRPLISSRVFHYAYKEIPYQGKGTGRLYAGSSVDSEELETVDASSRKDTVKAYLQGMFRIQEVGKNMCDVTYCVRVKPKGQLPKSVALLASNELVYTLFSLREKAETTFVQAKKRRRKRKTAAAAAAHAKTTETEGHPGASKL